MVGLVDFLVMEIDENPAYSVVNDKGSSWRSFETPSSIPIIYALKSQNKETKNIDINTLFYRWMTDYQVKFLESESQGRQTHIRSDIENMSELIRPYIMTDMLQDELMNLQSKQVGSSVDIQRISTGIQKDKYSALSYGLYWVYLEEKKNKSNKSETAENIDDFFMYKRARF